MDIQMYNPLFQNYPIFELLGNDNSHIQIISSCRPSFPLKAASCAIVS